MRDNRLGRFAGDEGGAVAIVFCFALTLALFMIGVSLDYGRALGASSRANAALDSATLAAAQFMTMNPEASEEDVRAYAVQFLNGQMAASEGSLQYGNVQVTIDRPAGTVTIASNVSVPTSFTRVLGYDSVSMTKNSQATFRMKGVELAMVLDVTGSMNQNGKLSDMKDAAKDVLEILLPDDQQTLNRIALAPYSASVNAGAYAASASNGATVDNCVVERDGSHAYTEDPPGPGRYFNAEVDRTRNARYGCPPAEIMPLSQDRAALEARIDGYGASGWTAGQIGIGWGWYQISPSWNSVWPSGSTPKPYSDANTIKAVLIMTDGLFNTSYHNGPINESSGDQALELCSNMKSLGVQVYSVAFLVGMDPVDPETLDAAAILQGCASSPGHYYLAENGEQLRTAFRNIAHSLQSLRISK